MRGHWISGFLECVSGPLVRSSYRAEQALARNNAGLDHGAVGTRRSPCRDWTLRRARRSFVILGWRPTSRPGGRCSASPMSAMPRHAGRDLAARASAVFTLGLNAKREHLLAPGDIPVMQIDRGGQVTYHGPGQLVVYPLIDLQRRGARGAATRDGAGECRHRLCRALSASTRQRIARGARACMSTARSSRASACGSGAARAITGSRSM